MPEHVKKTYRSDVLRSVHLAAEDLRAIGAIDEAAMRRFDEACLVVPNRTESSENH